MKNKRVVSLIISFITISIGLLARLNKQWFPDVVNLYLGDILYAFMMFYIVSFFAFPKKSIKRAIIALVICYCIEFFQLYQAEWVNAIRQTVPGRLVFGSGFLYSDLLSYIIGVAMAFLVDKFTLSNAKPTKGNIT